MSASVAPELVALPQAAAPEIAVEAPPLQVVVEQFSTSIPESTTITGGEAVTPVVPPLTPVRRRRNATNSTPAV